MRAAHVYLIYKLKPKVSVYISDQDRMGMFYIAYETNTYKCSYLLIILKLQAVSAEKN